MEIIISQYVGLKGDARTFHRVYKEFQSNVIPHAGDFIKDSAYKEPYEYEVASVIIDYTNNYCDVTLKIYELETTDDSFVKREVEMFMSHGWKCDTIYM
ncbi:hypothetical protein [Sporosarcina sp. UB5]|uniref:hypothetical protein n=1 Tax=Sporosarcina sp. UB5 TaxID=3047463 RepID=UPI003D7A7929